MRLAARFARRKVKISSLSVELFDPKDQSKYHNYLYRITLGGKSFFVKELSSPSYPTDSITQFYLHDRLNLWNSELKKWKASVLPYNFAWKDNKVSFLVSTWVPGITLEKWLQTNPGVKKKLSTKDF